MDVQNFEVSSKHFDQLSSCLQHEVWQDNFPKYGKLLCINVNATFAYHTYLIFNVMYFPYFQVIFTFLHEATILRNHVIPGGIDPLTPRKQE